jgi:iron-sulfur cluster repair protein YtfE (RIC family)
LRIVKKERFPTAQYYFEIYVTKNDKCKWTFHCCSPIFKYVLNAYHNKLREALYIYKKNCGLLKEVQIIP